jgi:hypothetical protein
MPDLTTWTGLINSHQNTTGELLRQVEVMQRVIVLLSQRAERLERAGTGADDA